MLILSCGFCSHGFKKTNGKNDSKPVYVIGEADIFKIF